jgi:tRNA threonylcarbamoyladenosine biosynthesis protein TsaB
LQPDPTILAFDTSAAHCAAALSLGGEIVATRHEEMVKGQAERLFPMLEEVMADANIGWSALDGIGVGTGPGNFTGIRIAVSAARGLALSLEVPSVGVSLFDALATGAKGDLVLTLGAPRNAIYVQTRIGGEYSEISVSDINDLPSVPPGTTCIGVRSDEVAASLGLRHAPASFAPAPAIARNAVERLEHSTDRPTPLYIRPADAAPSSVPQPVILP